MFKTQYDFRDWVLSLLLGKANNINHNKKLHTSSPLNYQKLSLQNCSVTFDSYLDQKSLKMHKFKIHQTYRKISH